MTIPWEKIPIFACLKPAALEFLTQKSKNLSVQPGEYVFREGEPGNKMFIIRTGSVNVCKLCPSKPGETVEIARLEAGNFFGEMCILETLPRAATIVALEETSLWSLSSIAFYEFYRAMPDQYSVLILNIARDLSRRVRRLDELFAAKS